jgi:hypothetical protein
MIYFPQVKNGVTTQLPFAPTFRFLTDVADLTSGSRRVYSWRGGGLTNAPTGPLAEWPISFQRLTDAGKSQLEAFFVARRGRLESFAFLDPSGNLVSNSETLTAGTWSGSGGTPGALDPFGRTNGYNVGSTTLVTTVLPDGDGLNLRLCASVYAKNQAITLQFANGGGSVWASRAFGATADWTRPALSAIVPNMQAVTLRIVCNGGQLFGAQCSPTPGPGCYLRTPGNPALFRNCRFGTDTLEFRTIAPNHHQVSFTIEEFAA